MQPHTTSPASRPDPEVLESIFVEMDPILDGFQGVLAELCFTGEEYRLSLTAAGSGNRLLDFASEDPDRAYDLFDQQLGKVSEGDKGAKGE